MLFPPSVCGGITCYSPPSLGVCECVCVRPCPDCLGVRPCPDCPGVRRHCPDCPGVRPVPFVLVSVPVPIVLVSVPFPIWVLVAGGGFWLLVVQIGDPDTRSLPIPTPTPQVSTTHNTVRQTSCAQHTRAEPTPKSGHICYLIFPPLQKHRT